MKTYDIENKIKSSKWNAFLIKQNEVEEYLQDDMPMPNDGLFSRFSKAKKENDARRNERMIKLLSPRVIKIKEVLEEYFKHNVIKPDKEIISMIVEPTKNVLVGRSVSSIFKGKPKDSDPISIKLQELINEGKKESGDIVEFYPIFIIQNGIEKGVLFITTKGICFVAIKDNDFFKPLPYVLGGIIGGVVTETAKHVIHSVKDCSKINNEHKKIIELSEKYSPCLIAKCFENSQFIPFNIINALIYGAKSTGNNVAIICLYQNIQKKVIFEIDQDIMIRIVKKLSTDNPAESI